MDAASHGRFFTNAGDVVIPLAAVVLALVVHAQQRWNYAIVSRMGKQEQKKLLHIFYCPDLSGSKAAGNFSCVAFW